MSVYPPLHCINRGNHDLTPNPFTTATPFLTLTMTLNVTLTLNLTLILFFGGGPKGGGGARPLSGGLEDVIAMIFSHHIYCAQSKVLWGAHGVNGGAKAPSDTPPDTQPPIVMPLVPADILLYNLKMLKCHCLSQLKCLTY